MLKNIKKRLLIWIVAYILTVVIGSLVVARVVEATRAVYIAPVEPEIVYPKNADTDVKKYAYNSIKEAWGASEWEAFNKIIQRESKWCHRIWNGMDDCPTEVLYENPTEGSNAYGLGQTMVSVHEVSDEFYDNPYIQIDWIIKYIKQKYDTPKQALIHHETFNFY